MVVMKKDTESERKRFIEKGGSVPETKDKGDWTNICLRIPKKMVIEIDNVVQENVGINRTGWILQTLKEKLNGMD